MTASYDRLLRSVWAMRPLAYWPLDSPIMRGGRTLDLTFGNNPTRLKPGPFGSRSLGFPGSAWALSPASSRLPDASDDLTVVAWMRWTTTGTVQRAMALRHGNANDSEASNFIANFPSGAGTFALRRNGYNLAATGATYNDGKWRMFAHTQQGTAAKLWIDGRENATSTIPDGSGGSPRMGLGQNHDGSVVNGQQYNGDVAHLIVFTRALSPAEMRHLFDLFRRPRSRPKSLLA